MNENESARRAALIAEYQRLVDRYEAQYELRWNEVRSLSKRELLAIVNQNQRVHSCSLRDDTMHLRVAAARSTLGPHPSNMRRFKTVAAFRSRPNTNEA